MLSHNTTTTFCTSPLHIPQIGAVDEWPQVPALLVLDSFAPQMRCQLLERAATHNPGVWVLQHSNPDEPDLATLWRISHLYAELPKESMWCTEKDAGKLLNGTWNRRALSLNQLWKLDTHPEVRQQGHALSPGAVQQQFRTRRTPPIRLSLE